MAGKTLKDGVGYIRVSRTGTRDVESDSYITEKVQRAEVEDLAKRHGYRIVSWYVDRDKSGGKWERPGFQAALEDIRTGRADGFFSAKLSRLARSTVNCIRGMEELTQPRHGRPDAEVFLGDFPSIDHKSPYGMLLLTILAAFTQCEREIARDNWATARGDAHGRKVYAGRPPAGYLRDKAKQLVPDPVVQPYVHELFTRRAAGASYADLLRFWNGVDVLPRKTLSGLQTMLTNRLYLGEYREDGKLIATHAPIVSVSLFDSVQAQRVPRPARSREGSMLAGLLECSGCGRPMTSTRNGKTRYYRCQGVSGGATVDGTPCQQRAAVTMDTVDAVVGDAFLDWAKQQLAEAVSDPTAAIELADALAKADKAEADLVGLLAAQSASDNPDLYRDEVAKRDAAVSQARDEVERIRTQGVVDSITTTIVQEWPELTAVQRRRLLAKGIDGRIVVQPASAPVSGQWSVDARRAAVASRLVMRFR